MEIPSLTTADVDAIFCELLARLDKDLMGAHITGNYRKDLIIDAVDNAKHDFLRRARQYQERAIQKELVPPLPHLEPTVRIKKPKLRLGE